MATKRRVVWVAMNDYGACLLGCVTTVHQPPAEACIHGRIWVRFEEIKRIRKMLADKLTAGAPVVTEVCHHRNATDYYHAWSCMEYCSGQEIHCRDCKMFVSSCQCGCCNGMSGWSEARWKKHERRKKQCQTA